MLDTGASKSFTSNTDLLSNTFTVDMLVNGISGVQAIHTCGQHWLLGEIYLCPELYANEAHITILSYVKLARENLIEVAGPTTFHLLDRPGGDIIATFSDNDGGKVISSIDCSALFTKIRERDHEALVKDIVMLARTANNYEAARQCSMLLKRCYFPCEEASRHLVRTVSGISFDASAVRASFDDPERLRLTEPSRRNAAHENNRTPSIELSADRVDLAVDVMHCTWSNRDVLIMVTTPYNYLLVAPLSSLSAESVHLQLVSAVNTLATANKKIRAIITDSASNLGLVGALLLKSHQVAHEPRCATSHNPRADIAIRYFKAKLRMVQVLLPITATTPVYNILLSSIAMTTNLIPCQQNGWMSSYSALFGRNETISLNGSWAATIGDSVYISNTSDKRSNSTNDLRSLQGIYLGFTQLNQHQVITAQSGILSRNNVTVSPTPFIALIKSLNDASRPRQTQNVEPRASDSESSVSGTVISAVDNTSQARHEHVIENSAVEVESLAPMISENAFASAFRAESTSANFNQSNSDAALVPDEHAMPAIDASDLMSLSAARRYYVNNAAMLHTIDIACTSELEGLMGLDTFFPIHMSDLSQMQKGHMLRSSMKFKMKHVNSTNPTAKARFVADPGGQPHDLYSREETSSSAVGASTVLSLFAIAASKDLFVRSFDIKQAYLHGLLSTPVPMFIRPEIARIICKIDSKYESYKRKDDSLTVMVKRGLYGQRPSGKIWWDILAASIRDAGFSQNAKDSYLFYKLNHNGLLAACVAIYVDDVFLVSRRESTLTDFENHLISRFEHITSSSRGNELKYLGMDVKFDRSNKTCSAVMADLVTKILSSRSPSDNRRPPTTPAQDDLFSIDAQSPLLSSELSDRFHSIAAQLLYLAKHTRPDLLCAVQFLTTRVRAPSAQDAAKLDRVIDYLAGTEHTKLILGGDKGNTLKLNAYFDASYSSLVGGLSQMGSFITLGRGSIYSASKKLSVVCMSAAEAELYALSEGAHELLHLQQILEGLSLESVARPANVQQDNQSVIASIKNGRACSTRSKHIEQRHYWVSYYCTIQKFIVHHCRTELMIADILTKPLQGAQFALLRDKLLGHQPIDQ